MPINKDWQNDLCERLWYNYSDYIKRLCNIKLGNRPHDAEDVLLDTYVSLCVAVSECRDIRDERAWLFKTADNLINVKLRAIAEIRGKEVSIQSADDEYPVYDLPYSMDFIEDMIKEKSIYRKISDIFSSLNDMEKDIFIKFQLEDFSYAEIAEIYGSTEQAIKQINYRTKRKIAQLVKVKAEELYAEI
ncbi:MAG: sigma-70 family RNA polymerase sigma factor [Eubacterium sp.]|nr:sigma-70 family RNA polymerase sigma factor [Eubacterium sp.]